ncbi:MAG: 5'-nucleotidase [Armatimonadaceae bacterium]
MPYTLHDKIVIAVSSRALFDLEDAHAVFDESNPDSYLQYQLDHLDEMARPGVAFELVRKFLAFNTPQERRVEVVVLSRNDPVSGLRVFHSAEQHGLDIVRGVFTRGRPPYGYLEPFNAVLFLSANEDDVRGALERECPAARVYTGPRDPSPEAGDELHEELRIAFDGDGVLFDDSSEAYYKTNGLDAFQENEVRQVGNPLTPGPLQRFFLALRDLKHNPPAGSPMRVRTALITARSAPAHRRAIETLQSWHLEVDEAFFLGGVEKRGFLAEFSPDIFFDDQTLHTEPAALVARVGHVPYGVANRPVVSVVNTP